jgi:DNA replication protein DnaD
MHEDKENVKTTKDIKAAKEAKTTENKKKHRDN